MPFLGKRGRWLGLTTTVGIVILCAGAGNWLVVNRPQPADVIVCLYGGTWARQQAAVALLERGLAPRLIFDVDDDADFWNVSDADLARHWIARQPAAEAARMGVCATGALSTAEEAKLTLPCLGAGVHRVLLVTSAYHTRRALAVYRHSNPEMAYSMAAADEPEYFGRAWWRQREWAKTVAGEWLKFAWWEAIDRWRRVS